MEQNKQPQGDLNRDAIVGTLIAHEVNSDAIKLMMKAFDTALQIPQAPVKEQEETVTYQYKDGYLPEWKDTIVPGYHKDKGNEVRVKPKDFNIDQKILSRLKANNFNADMLKGIACRDGKPGDEYDRLMSGIKDFVEWQSKQQSAELENQTRVVNTQVKIIDELQAKVSEQAAEIEKYRELIKTIDYLVEPFNYTEPCATISKATTNALKNQ